MTATSDRTNGTGFGVHAQLALGMAMFGSATPISKIVTAAMPVFVGAGLRVLLGALVLAPAAWRHRAAVRRLDRGQWLRIGVVALFGMVGFTAFMLYGMRLASGVAGAVVMSTTPAVTAAASMMFLGDRPTWRKLAAIALAVAGVVILQLGQGGGNEGSGSPLLGMALIFAAVCCETVYTLVDKTLTERVDPVLVAFLAAAVSVPLFVPLAAWQWPSFQPGQVTTGAWAAVAWYGAGTLALGSWLWYAGVAKAEGTVAAAFMGVMPVSALLLSYVLLGEAFRWMHLAGFATVFAGVLLMSWEHARMSRED